MNKMFYVLAVTISVGLLSCDFNSRYQGSQNVQFDLKALKLPKDLSYQVYDVSLKLYEGSSEVYNNLAILEIIGSDIQPIDFGGVPEGDFQMELVISKGGLNYVHITTDATIEPGPNFVELNQTDFNGGWVDESMNTITQGSTISISTNTGSIALDSQYENVFTAATVSPFAINYDIYVNTVFQTSISAPFNSGTWIFNIAASVTDGDNIEIKFSPANPSSQESAIDAAGGPPKFADYRLKFTYGP